MSSSPYKTIAAVRILAVTAAITCFLSTTASAQNYVFTNIADTTGPINDFGFAAINNGGTVAFAAGMDSSGERIFTSDGGPLTSVADNDTGPFRGFYGYVAINDPGTVAFSAQHNDGRIGAFTTPGDGTYPVITDSNGPLVGVYEVQAINNAGTVAFRAAFPNSPGNQRSIFTGNGGPLTTIATDDSSDTFGSIYFSEHVALNNGGALAFTRYASQGNDSPQRALLMSNGQSLTTLADASGEFSQFGPRVGINDSGTIAFSALLDSGTSALYTAANGTVTALFDSAGPFQIFGAADINDGGDLAFTARLDSGEFGIFTGPDPATDKVIAEGDALFGRTVTSVSFRSGDVFSNSGEILMYYTLDNGVTGYAVATPVPEPGSLSLLAIGGLATLRRFSTRRAMRRA